VNIEEKLEDLKQPIQFSKKKQLSDEEKKELRRKQQEKALQFQTTISDNIKISYKSKRVMKDDEIEETDEDEDEEEEKKKNQNINDLNMMNERFDQMMIDEKKARENSEEYNSMFDEMLREYDKNIDRKNNEFISKEIEKKLDQHQQKSKKSVKWSDENLNKINNIEIAEYDSDDYDEDDEYDEDYQGEEEVELDNGSKLKPTPLTIHIKHTKTAEIDEIEKNLKLSRDKPEINSPGDIYTHFYKPKSILKSSSTTSISSSDEMKSSDIDEKSKIVQKLEPKNAESGKFEPEKVRSILNKFILDIYYKLCLFINQGIFR
jgi:hypothetical protein